MAWARRTKACRATSLCSINAAARSLANPTGRPASCHRRSKARCFGQAGIPFWICKVQSIWMQSHSADNWICSHNSTRSISTNAPAAENSPHASICTNSPTACSPRRPRQWICRKKSQATRNQYGIGMQPTDEYGRNCLIARRLVERGVRFIQLYSGGGHLEDTWDGHESIEKNHGLHGAEVDQPIAALLTDLEQRGCSNQR